MAQQIAVLQDLVVRLAVAAHVIGVGEQADDPLEPPRVGRAVRAADRALRNRQPVAEAHGNLHVGEHFRF